MAFIPELEGRPLEELLAFLDGGATADNVPEDERPLWLDEAARYIGESGEAGLDHLLRRAAGSGAASAIAAALLGLSFVPEVALSRRREEVKAVHLTHALGIDPLLAARAIDGLRLLGYDEVQGQLLPLLSHQSPYVVGSVLRYLAAYEPEVALPVLLNALNSTEPIIRSNAIDELDELECVEALPRLRRLLTDPDEDVRAAARGAVANLEEARS